MIKSIKRFLINLARYCLRSILWVIRTYKGLNDKSNIAKDSFQTKSFASKKVTEPKYMTEAHRKNSEAGMRYQNSLNPSKIDWKKEKERQKNNARKDSPIFTDQETEPFIISNIVDNNEPEQSIDSFDWTTLTKKELDTLYHQIIDKALENYEYRLYVLFKWKINHEEFNYRAARSLAIRIRREEQRMKKHDIIDTYFKKRWANMTPEEVEADRKWMIDQGKLRNPN